MFIEQEQRGVFVARSQDAEALQGVLTWCHREFGAVGAAWNYSGLATSVQTFDEAANELQEVQATYTLRVTTKDPQLQAAFKAEWLQAAG